MNFLLFRLFSIIGFVAVEVPVEAQSPTDKASISERAMESITWCHPLTVIELVIVILVFVAMPIYSWYVSKNVKSPNDLPKRKGLNLPAGSVRSMIALLVVGSFVNFLIFGESVLATHFDKILAAFGTLSGSIIGFYFGNRSAEPLQTGDNSIEKPM